MNIQNIHQGDTYKNYIALCDALQIPVQSSTSKTKQLKEMNTYFRYHRNGHKYIIDEVYPQRQIVFTPTGTQFHQRIKAVLTQYLLRNGPISVTKSELYSILGLVNQNFQAAKLKPARQAAYFRNVVMYKCWGIVIPTIKKIPDIISMNSQCLIDGIQADPETEDRIQKLELETCNELHCLRIDEVYEKNLSFPYHSSLNAKLKEAGIGKVSHKLSLKLLVPERILPMTDEEIKKLRLETNQRIIDGVTKKIQDSYDHDRKELFLSDIDESLLKNYHNAFALLTRRSCKDVLNTFIDSIIRLEN